MRLISLLILVAIVGFGAYVYFCTDWLSKAKKEVDKAIRTHVEGFGPAKSPREAMDQFLKAVKKRNFKAAAVYSTKDYADALIKSHDGASALGDEIDYVRSYLDDKQLASDKTTQLLFLLDPFPAAYLEVGDVKEVKGKKDEKAKQLGAFVFKPPVITQGFRLDDLKSLDPKIVGLNAVGAPTVANLGVHEIKSEGEGDEKVWKIDFPVPQPVREAVDYFNSNYKRYVSGMQKFRTTLRTESMLKDKIAPELLDVLIKSK
jgi:hypothetical protein